MKLSKTARQVTVALTITIAVLAAANALISWLERGGKVVTVRGIDDMITFVDGSLFADDGHGMYSTTFYAEFNMVHSTFPVHKGDAWRLFVLGESFAMGVPYTQPEPGGDKPGGIPSFLEADLKSLAPPRQIEVINAAAGGQNSHRVMRTAEQIFRLDPDMLLLATCNNEGAIPPSEVTETLRKFAGFRWLTKLLIPRPKPEERSYYTAQDAETKTLRDAFRSNVHAILNDAAKKNVKVLLCTMPVNLRYDGDEPGHVTRTPSPPAQVYAPCIADARKLVEENHPADAEALLRSCDDVESLRLLGQIAYDAERYEEAHTDFEQYTELVPRNRCRPSFNQVIREEAAAFPGNVRLVDLQSKAEEISPHRIPGDELFIDYCHMNWHGYAAMEDAVLKTADAAGWLPGRVVARPSLEDLRKRFGLE